MPLVDQHEYGFIEVDDTGAVTTIQRKTVTTDPAKIQPRVARASGSPHPFGTSPFVVGCGRAARATFVEDGARHNAIEVIRLADGATWHLPDAPGSAWSYRAPLALTCDELFARVYERAAPGQPGHFNVARVRLDGLGAPVQ